MWDLRRRRQQPVPGDPLTSDAGKTWSTLHSEPYQGDHAYISLAVDLNGAVHAMHYTTDNLGSAISYDGHYVLTQ